MSTRNRPGLGILLILCSGLLLASQDVLAKILTAAYPLLLVVWFRYLAQNLSTVAVFAPKEGKNLFKTQRPLLQLARGVSLIGVTLLFFGGLQMGIPLGEATAVMFMAPLVVVLISVFFLKEKVSLGVWFAVFGGIAGVLLIVRPGGELFTPAVLLPVGAAISFGIYQLLTRSLSAHDSPATSNFLSSLVGLIVATIALPFVWETPEPIHILMMLALGVLSMSGHVVFTYAYRYGSAANLAPFTYAQIVIATIMGFAFFSHTPDLIAVLGMAVIIVSGASLIIVQAKARRAARIAAEAAAKQA